MSSTATTANHTVLARKWRPKTFSELVGQTHVMQALANALDQQRIHHAYLFTGTRGVGKTTIARIFSKALNCEQGVSSTPCGVCDVCRSIDEGRFIDLIEVDAASRTKVDDTREILDNVQFAPTQGRYKVYLIDEVHMLSKSSFNALLKTLEEPPEHVKFLLATTDPHKLPITVLSRCLQFNLMRLTQVQLETHLAFILTQEAVPFDKSALALIAKGADGSARDALSLLDQAIAYGAGEVMFDAVQTMLGWVDQQYSFSILNALASEDSEQLKQAIQQLAVMGVDYQALLAQLIEVLHALSYFQVFGDVTALSIMPEEVIETLAGNLNPERVQLLYQIALLARQDMLLAPDIRIGFEMALIRMLAFQPVKQGEDLPDSPVLKVDKGGEKIISQASQGFAPKNALEGLASARSLMANKSESDVPIMDAPMVSEPVPDRLQSPQQGGGQDELSLLKSGYSGVENFSGENPSPPVSSSSDHLEQIKARLKQQPLGKLSIGANAPLEAVEPSKVSRQTQTVQPSETPIPVAPINMKTASTVDTVEMKDMVTPPLNTETGGGRKFEENQSDNIEQWLALIEQLPLKGMAAEVARNSVLTDLSATKMAVSIDPEQNYSRQTMALEQFSEAVKQHFGFDFELEFVSISTHFTPVKYEEQQAKIRQKKAEESIEQDPVVQALTQTLGLDVVVSSIKPI
ncbi:DNA polymerase III subunits gamma and tau [hydrothermal vent metagenome]|uniref:DNA-directed DNA polymerase n=1 Tax=hydrothermal vent metagenome TaxID=652676 RepID=A0A3B0WEN7_9ZZZZ